MLRADRSARAHRPDAAVEFFWRIVSASRCCTRRVRTWKCCRSHARQPALPGPIFDTQIAAALLGYPAQIGYGSLVAERLGHTLAKGHTRTDWSRRPSERGTVAVRGRRRALSRAAVCRICATRWKRPAACDWLYEDTRELEQLGSAPHRARGGVATAQGTGSSAAASSARRRSCWRNGARTTAITHDKPRGWILADDALREIAERLPRRPSRARSRSATCRPVSCDGAARSCWR